MKKTLLLLASAIDLMGAISDVRISTSHAQALLYAVAPDSNPCTVQAWGFGRETRIKAASWAANVVTVETVLAHGLRRSGQSVYLETSIPEWNGPQTATFVDEDTFTFASPTSGSATGGQVGFLINDLDPTLWLGANSDDRTGNIVRGRERWVVIGQRRAERKPGTIDSYSRALQNSSRYKLRYACGPDVHVQDFYTKSIPLGTLAVDRPVPDLGALSAWPTLKKDARWDAATGVVYDPVIDPLTGSLYTPMYPPEIATDTSVAINTTNTPVPAGLNWVNPGSVRAQDGVTATYTGSAQDTLCIRPYRIIVPNDNAKAGWYTSNVSLESVVTTVRGSSIGTGADGDVEVAYSIDGCQTAATNWNTIDLTGSLSSVSYPSGVPRGGFGDWHSASQRRLNHIDVVTRRNYADVNGTAVTLRPDTGAFTHTSNFDPAILAPGSRIRIGGTANDNCDAGTEYTIASIQHQRALTLTADAGTLTNTWWCAANFAVMLRKKTASLDPIEIDYVNLTLRTAANAAGHDSGSAKIFSEKPVIDGDGNVGYLSVTGGVGGSTNTMHWVSEVNGESRFIMGWLVNLPGKADPEGWQSGICSATENSFVSTEPDSFICMMNANTGGGKVLVKYKLRWTGSSAWKSRTPSGSPISTCTSISPPTPNPCLEASNLTSSYSLGDLISARNAAYEAAKYGCGIRGVQAQIVVLNCTRSIQDTSAWVVAFDMDKPIANYNPGDQSTNPVAGALSLHHEALQGFSVLHTGWVLPGEPGGSRYIAFNPKFGRKNGATNHPGAGPWRMAVVGDSPLNNTSDIYPCPTNDWGYSDCSTIHVTSHPYDPDPGTGETGMPGEYGEVKPGYSFLIWKCNPADPNYLGYETYSTNEGYHGAGCYTYASENGRVLSVSGSAPDLVLVVARRIVPGQSARNHAAGYSLYMWPVNEQGKTMADVSVIWDFRNAPTGSLSDVRLAYGSLAHGAFTARAWVGDLDATGFGNVVYKNPTPSSITALPSVNLSLSTSWPVFAGKQGIRFANDIQNYNAVNHTDFDPNRETAFDFYFDSRPWMSMLLSSAHYYWEKVGGTNYLYKYSRMADGTYLYPLVKHLPFLVYSGSYLLSEKSGPASTLADTSVDHWKQCIVERANECRPGSVPGNIYINVPWAYTTGGSADYRCYTAVYTWNEADICATPLDPMLGPSVQYYYGASDTMARGRHIRKIGWGLVEHKYVNKVPKVSPRGTWLGPLWTHWLNRHRSSGALMMKLPPIPPDDGLDRTTFVPVPISTGTVVPAGTAFARVEFGYQDFGSPAQMYCTERTESCLATGSKVIGDAVWSPWTTSNENAAWRRQAAVSNTTPVRVTFPTAHKFTADVKLRASSNTSAKNAWLWPISIASPTEVDLVGSVAGDLTVTGTANTFVPKYEAPFAFSGESFSVAGATNAAPIEISTTSMHRFQTGSNVCLGGIGGNTAANGCWTITATGPSSFTLNGSSGVGGSAYTSGGTVSPGGVPCAAGCSVVVPAVTGRLMFYRLQFLAAAGQVVATDSVKPLVVP